MSAPAGDQCAALEPALVELALGVLAGEERTAVLGHVEGCPRCSARLVELSAAADDLLHLAPPAEPPVGFEARVFERLGLSAPTALGRRQLGRRQLGRRQLGRRQLGRRQLVRRRLGRRRWGGRWGSLALSTCAGAALGLAFIGGAFAGGAFGGGALGGGALGGGALGGGHPRTSPSGPYGMETAALSGAGGRVGQVMVYASSPTWVFMYVDLPAWDSAASRGPLRCQVLEDQGPTVTIGKFWLAGGKGAWAASVAQPAGRLRVARVVDAAGHVLATAHLP